MGYGVRVSVGHIVIEADKVASALKALSDLFRNGDSYHWCDGPKNIEAGYRSIFEAIEDWRFESGADLEGNIKITNFIGEKIRDDKLFWETLAPYITCVHYGEHQNSWVVYAGEDGEKWRYNFIDGKMNEEKSVFESEIDNKELTEERTKRVTAQLEIIELKKQIAKLKAALGPNYKVG